MTSKPASPLAQTKFVVTLPPEPSPLRRALEADIASAYTALIDTTDAFRHIALRAHSRLVVMMPYIDRSGAQWALEVFRLTKAHERILILRDVSKIDALGPVGGELRSAVTAMHDYGGVDPEITLKETFHAKIVLADGSAAYVGSANLLRRSRETNLECGMLVEGPAVFGVKVLVDAVLASLQHPVKVSGDRVALMPGDN
jgi:hypothetical protein